MRKVWILVLWSSLVAQCFAVANPMLFKIPAGAAEPALELFGKQSGLQVLYTQDTVNGHQTQAVNGQYEPTVALTKLLRDSGLTYRVANEHTVTIVPVGHEGPIVHDQAQPPASTEGTGEGTGGTGVASRQNSSTLPLTLEEVVVSAQKREERLQDVPVPVTALSASTLLESSKLRLQDYYNTVPGLDLTLDNRGSPVISIRGITTSFYSSGSTPTVGITVDDVPFENTGPSTFSPIPDVDPNELARVEVLRGPQGTLYGSSSIGGLVKYVTIDPSTERMSGYAEAGLGGVQHGDKIGYNFSGGVNIPLTDDIAIRASGFTHDDRGYIDNVETGQRDVNERKVYGGRVAALWKPSEDFSLKLSALYQDSKAFGPSQVDVATPGYGLPALRDLQQNNLIGTGGYDRRIQAYSANINAQLGAAKLTSVTGYNISRASDSFDFTYILGPATLNQFHVPGTAFEENNTAHKFTQEVRLSMPLGTKLDWLVGAFYTHEITSPIGGDVAIDSTGTQVGRWLDQRSTETYTEYAAFTDLTVHVTDQFDVQFGGRESENRTTNESILIGPYDTTFLQSPSPVINPEVGSKNNSFTYLVTPKYTFSSGLMAYARLASGYRPGGPNSAVNALLHLPTSFAPDTTRNYEVGVKGDLLDKLISFDASVYYIDWKDIQITIFDPNTSISYGANGSRAKSQGEELSFQLRPAAGLTMDGWLTWSNAVLTQPFPPAPAFSGLPNAASGDRLPYSSRFSAHLSLEQDVPLSGNLIGFGAIAASYVGDRKGEFTNAPPRQDLPAYTTVDLRLGARLDPWAFNLFVTNVTDRRGLLQGGIGFFPAYAFDIVQPRTFGFTATRKF